VHEEKMNKPGERGKSPEAAEELQVHQLPQSAPLERQMPEPNAFVHIYFFDATGLEPGAPPQKFSPTFYDFSKGPKHSIESAEPKTREHQLIYGLTLPTGCPTLVAVVYGSEVNAVSVRPGSEHHRLDWLVGQAPPTLTGGTVEVTVQERGGHDHGHSRQLDHIRVSAELVRVRAEKSDSRTVGAEPQEPANISATTRNGIALLELVADGLYGLQVEVPCGYRLQTKLQHLQVCGGEFIQIPLYFERCSPTLTLVVTDPCGERVKEDVPLLIDGVEHCVQDGECVIHNPRVGHLHLSSPNWEFEPNEIHVSESMAQAVALRATAKIRRRSLESQRPGFTVFLPELDPGCIATVVLYECDGSEPIRKMQADSATHQVFVEAEEGRDYELEGWADGVVFQQRIRATATR
jgi:hypothetical protein